VGRLPDEKIMLAALGIMFWTEVLIEAPVIMLLSTSTALTTSAQAYQVVRRFTIHLNLLVTVVAVAFIDPLYDLVLRRLMGIPPEIADPTQTGMRIMALWSAAIGWRRFNQGILIRFGQPRHVTWGTVLRLVTSATVAATLVHVGRFSGIVVAATTFMISVTTEALYAWWKSRPIVARLRAEKEPPSRRLTYRAVLDFHLPLAATSVLSFLALPLLNGGLARMASPQEALAAWPVLYSIILLFRGPGIALPETVISLLKGSDDIPPLRRFCWLIAGLSTLGLALVSITSILSPVSAIRCRRQQQSGTTRDGGCSHQPADPRDCRPQQHVPRHTHVTPGDATHLLGHGDLPSRHRVRRGPWCGPQGPGYPHRQHRRHHRDAAGGGVSGQSQSGKHAQPMTAIGT